MNETTLLSICPIIFYFKCFSPKYFAQRQLQNAEKQNECKDPFVSEKTFTCFRKMRPNYLN